VDKPDATGVAVMIVDPRVRLPGPYDPQSSQGESRRLVCAFLVSYSALKEWGCGLSR
jgi:hypothetical protein